LNWIPPRLAFNKLEVRIDFNKDEPGSRGASKGVSDLPRSQVPDLVRRQRQPGSRCLKANGEFDAKPAVSTCRRVRPHSKVGADLGATAGAKAGFVIGPFSYSIKRAVINHRRHRQGMARWKSAARGSTKATIRLM